MGLTINGKLLVRLCTKAGNSPYNKEGAKVYIDSERIVDKYSYKGGDLVVLRPVIDKLIFEYNFKDCGIHKGAIQDVVVSNLKRILEEQSVPLKKATANNVGGKRLYYLNKNYQHNYVLVYKPTGAKTIIQLLAKKQGVAFMRCELNPARLGAEGMTFFRVVLDLLMCNDFKDITFETIAKTKKGIKRIDIAVDLLGVDACDLEGQYIYKDKKLKNQVFENHTGRLETNYFQLPENDKNQAYWYNKKQCLIDKTQDPIDGGQKSPYGQALYTRFEYRINETDKPIANLNSLTNHLKKVKFRAVDYTKIQNQDFTHTLFLRYALNRTRNKALEMIPDELQEKYAASYDKAIIDIWKPEKIWDKGWCPELVSLGLLAPESLKKKARKKKL